MPLLLGDACEKPLRERLFESVFCFAVQSDLGFGHQQATMIQPPLMWAFTLFAAAWLIQGKALAFAARVLVTGGAGYIGSHTCVELIKAGEKVSTISVLR